MNTKRLLIRDLVLIACFCSSACALTFDDGAEHNIGYLIDQPVDVDRNSPQAGTVVNLLPSGTINAWLDAYQDSRVNIAGSIGASLKTFDNSRATVNGAAIGGPIFANDNSIMDIYGGSFNAWIDGRDNAQIIISGGSFEASASTSGKSTMTITGGTFGQNISAHESSVIYIHGHSFTVNSQPVPAGVNAGTYAAMGTITGTLANGDPLNNNYNVLGPDAKIILIPEPATILILAAGIPLIRKHNKKGN